MNSHNPGEAVWTGVSAGAFLVGLGFALAPRRLGRLYGLPPHELAGASDFAWRLFAARNLVVGGAALAGSQAARRTILPVQIVDQTIFLHALATRSVPPRTAAMGMATSAAIVVACLAASRAERSARLGRSALRHVDVGRIRAPGAHDWFSWFRSGVGD